MIKFALSLSLGAFCYAQSTGGGVIHGTVVDPSGAAIKGASVRIVNPVSGYDRTVQSDDQGRFEFSNLPFNNDHRVAAATGFQAAEQDLNIRSSVPMEVKFGLRIGAATTAVTVAGAGDLIETDSTAHTDVDRQLFDKFPLESSSSSLSSLVTLATPGISADSNGLFHGLGDHASNSFSVDGQPISDQQSKVFSNQIPLGREHREPESRLHPLMVPDSQFLRLANGRRLVRSRRGQRRPGPRGRG